MSDEEDRFKQLSESSVVDPHGAHTGCDDSEWRLALPLSFCSTSRALLTSRLLTTARPHGRPSSSSTLSRLQLGMPCARTRIPRVTPSVRAGDNNHRRYVAGRARDPLLPPNNARATSGAGVWGSDGRKRRGVERLSIPPGAHLRRGGVVGGEDASVRRPFQTRGPLPLRSVL